MSEPENAQLIQSLYAAFGRGDIPTLLEGLSDSVEWTNPVPKDIVPPGGLWVGRQGVADFFTAVGGSLEFLVFEPRDFVAQGDKVVVLGYYEARVKSTGKTYSSEWVMAWTLDNGQVVKFREYADTAAELAAFTP